MNDDSEVAGASSSRAGKREQDAPATTGTPNLAEILHSWKSFNANELNRRLGRTGQLWQHESYDHIVRNEPAMHAIRRYIRDNPKVAGASSPGADLREQDAPATLPES